MPESSLSEIAGSACNFIEPETPVQVFSCEFCDIFKNNYFLEHLQTGTQQDYILGYSSRDTPLDTLLVQELSSI